MLQSCILGNSRLLTNQQCRTQEPKRSRKTTKKQWQSSNSRFASVQTSDRAGIHWHAAFICIAYTKEHDGSKILTHSVNTGWELASTWDESLYYFLYLIALKSKIFAICTICIEFTVITKFKIHSVEKVPGIGQQNTNYLLFIRIYFIAFKVGPYQNNTFMPTNNSIIKTSFKRIFRTRLQFSPRILFYVFCRLKTGASKW